MVRDPRVSVSIIDSADPENYVELRGRVSLTPDVAGGSTPSFPGSTTAAIPARTGPVRSAWWCGWRWRRPPATAPEGRQARLASRGRVRCVPRRRRGAVGPGRSAGRPGPRRSRPRHTPGPQPLHAREFHDDDADAGWPVAFGYYRGSAANEVAAAMPAARLSAEDDAAAAEPAPCRHNRSPPSPQFVL